ncbi:tetratricopeptide repeat protein [Micromonospora sp. HM5-17]|nr:tetratricopeptide repeat protein [Micromonospora sp. HM5-17]
MLVSAVAGMAGIGKTELVLQAASRALRTPGWFPGGVLFVDLFGYDSDRRLSAADALLGWLQAIGIPGEHIPAGEQDRARLWRSVLTAYVRQGRRLLLIIDNAADTTQVTPLLPADADIPVLITSRHTLDIDARLHDLNYLDTDAAIDLITKVVALRRGDDTRMGAPDHRAAIADLVNLCAGLPLALRIVAALLADRPQPAALATLLRDTRHRLDRLVRRETTGELAVRAAFDLSYRHLTPQQARMFRLLPINPGPDIGTTAAARLADLPADEATILLQDLHRAHLIDEPATDRWRMHDLIRLYAASQPADTPDEADATRQRLSTYYQDTAYAAITHLDPTVKTDTTVFETREGALAWLDTEHANLISACTTSTDLAFTIADYLDFRRYFDDLITITTLAADIYRQAGDRHRVGRALNHLGSALRQVGRVDEAIAAHIEAAEIYCELGDRRGESAALNNLGVALAGMRRFDKAITVHTRDLKICRELGDRHGEGTALNNLGVALIGVRRFDRASTAHLEAVKIYRELDDRYHEGAALAYLGVVLLGLGRLDKARELWNQAVQAFADAGDTASAEGVRQWMDEPSPEAMDG